MDRDDWDRLTFEGGPVAAARVIGVLNHDGAELQGGREPAEQVGEQKVQRRIGTAIRTLHRWGFLPPTRRFPNVAYIGYMEVEKLAKGLEAEDLFCASP